MVEIFLGIILLFFLLLLIKSISKKEFCVICASISLTWLGLLLSSSNKIFIALLMGQTILGIYYFLEKRFPIFRLPIILTLTFLGYALLSYDISAWWIILILWLTFLFISLYKKNTKINKIINKLIQCCKNW